MMIMNEKIKASEVHLTGLAGEDLGIVTRDEALAQAKALKADLVCTSLFSSPLATSAITSRSRADRVS